MMNWWDNAPQEILICGEPCKVIYAPEKGFALGYYSPSDGEMTISICEFQTEQSAKHTMLHEIIHGVDREMGRDNSEFARYLEGEVKRNRDDGYCLQEEEVAALSRGIWWTLSDPRNKNVTEWIFSEPGSGRGSV